MCGLRRAGREPIEIESVGNPNDLSRADTLTQKHPLDGERRRDDARRRVVGQRLKTQVQEAADATAQTVDRVRVVAPDDQGNGQLARSG